MGTHPIFESDFDCLTEKVNIRQKLEHVRPTCYHCPWHHPQLLALCANSVHLWRYGRHVIDGVGAFCHVCWCLRLHWLCPLSEMHGETRWCRTLQYTGPVERCKGRPRL